MSIREDLLLWADQFKNDHYVFEAYGDEYTVDLPRETVETAIDMGGGRLQLGGNGRGKRSELLFFI